MDGSAERGTLVRAVIFANGELNDPERVRRELTSDDLLVAADGGAAHCLALGLTPAAVIGDLDSLSAELQEQLEPGPTEFIHHPRRKDQTDLELAMVWARSAGASELLIVAATGGRLDQTLANLLLGLHDDLEELPITFLAGRSRASLVRGRQQVTGQPGDRVSLIPLSGDARGITTAGLEYELKDGSLPLGSTLGVSNVLVEQEAEVVVREGQVLLIHERQADEEQRHAEHD